MFILIISSCIGGEFRVGTVIKVDEGVQRMMLGADMDNLHRYHLTPGSKITIPHKPVTRKTYIDFLLRAPSHMGDGLYRDSILNRPKRGQYGPRHALPALAIFVATGEKRYAEAIKIALKDFYRVLKETAQKDPKKVVWYMFVPTLLELHFRILKEKGAIGKEDEVWIKDLFVTLNRNIHVWGNEYTYWRGPRHRSQGEGMMKRLCSLRYPDLPEVKQWLRYSELVWNDWWEYRDIACNDAGYCFGSLFPVVLGAHLLGKKEVFTDPEMVKFWENWMYQISPDGSTVPYGASGGWNSGAENLIWMLELVSRYTRDGRFRWVAHRLMNYIEYNEKNLPMNHLKIHFTQLGVSLAYLLADDTVQPVPPQPTSRILYRKETLRVKDKKSAGKYLKNLDPAPDKAHVCCNLVATNYALPHKLVFRSGWKPGDLFMLVELYPRHEPLNVTGILGLTPTALIPR